MVCKIWEAGVRAGGSFWRSLATGPQHMGEHIGEVKLELSAEAWEKSLWDS